MQVQRRVGLFIPILFVMALAVSACSPPVAAPAGPPITDAAAPLELAQSIDAATLATIQERADVVVLDVREQWEYDEGHIPGVVHIPMNDVPARLSEIPTDGTVIISCRSGNRSSQVTNFLREQGYANVHNLDGGILGWQSAGLPVEQ